MKHGLNNTSNFGTDINVQNNKTLIIPYLVERAASFFQAVTNNIATNLQDTKFVDCENYRYGCSVVSNHANCPTAKPGAVAVDALLKNQFRTLCSTSASQTEAFMFPLTKTALHILICLICMAGRLKIQL